MRQQTFRGTGILLLALILVAVLWFFQALQGGGQQRMTNQAFLQALEYAEISHAVINQNEQAPTGEVILLIDGQEYSTYVADVNEARKLLDPQDVD